VMATSRETWQRKPEIIRAATRALAKSYAYAREHPKETVDLLRPYFKDVDPDLFTKAAETHLKGVPKTPTISPEQVERAVAWMNIGPGPKVSAAFDAVVLSEPARDAIAALATQ
jgi:ABC-type nitrate/sulfonate/bicarbonate transport system substrate-binding protein